MKNILIIGGSYFAGRVFVEYLSREKDYKVYVFNRGNLPLQFKDVIELKGDRENETDIGNIIPDIEWDALVDFCAYTPDHISKMINFLTGKINHYIFISTATVYDHSLDLPIREGSPGLKGPQPELGQAADYGYHKLLAERKLEQECESKGIGYTALRPAMIYGKYNYAPRESYFFDLIRDNEKLILPDNKLPLFSFVWVDDLARILIKCLENNNVFNMALNVSSGELVSYRRFVEILEKISGCRLEIVSMKPEEIDARRIPLPFPLDSHLIYSGEKIRKILDFEYTDLLSGMKKTYEYYKLLQERKKEMAERKIK